MNSVNKNLVNSAIVFFSILGLRFLYHLYLDNYSEKIFYLLILILFVSIIIKIIYYHPLFFQSLVFILFGLIIITILYGRFIVSIDYENWEIEKCKPKYILYSGYLKENPNSTAYDSTTDNFNDCIIRFNNKADNRFSKFLEKNYSEHLLKINNIVDTNNKINAKKALELRKRLDRKKNEFELEIKKIENAKSTFQLQKEINKLNDLIFDIEEYAHTYLTYAMSHFLFQYKIAENKGELEYNLYNDDNDDAAEIYCKNKDQETCDSDKYCKYLDGDSCKPIKKGEFYEQEAINLNNTIKKYFGNNKL